MRVRVHDMCDEAEAEPDRRESRDKAILLVIPRTFIYILPSTGTVPVQGLFMHTLIFPRLVLCIAGGMSAHMYMSYPTRQ